MATLGNFVGFETGDTHEAFTTAATVASEKTAFGMAPHSGDYRLRVENSSGQYDWYISEGVTIAGNQFLVGFYVALDVISGAAGTFFECRDDSGNLLWDLFRVSGANGNIRARDSAGTTIGSDISGAFPAAETYIFIEVRWQHSATGDFDLHIDGVEQINQSSIDMDQAGAVTASNAFYRFTFGGIRTFFDDGYSYFNATGPSDFLGNAEIYRYQYNTNAVTTDVGTDLSVGVWQDMGETPITSDATEPGMTGSGLRGGSSLTQDTQSGDNYRPGPSDDNLSGTIKGGKYLGRLRRGNGSGTTHRLRWGSSGSETNSIVSLNIGFENFFVVRASSVAEVPESTEDFSIGIQKDAGGRDIYGEEQFGFILHVPAADGVTNPGWYQSIGGWW